MEPVSTLIAITSLAAAAATSRQRWEPPRIESQDYSNTVLVNSRAVPTDILVVPTAVTKNALLIGSRGVSAPKSAPQFLSLKDRLLDELKLYDPKNPAADQSIVSSVEDVHTASEFLRKLPAGIPLPTLMRSDDGQIGMYWDSKDVYIDINIEPAQTLSMFTRMRSVGAENFIDGIPLGAIDASWAFNHLGALTLPSAIAA